MKKKYLTFEEFVKEKDFTDDKYDDFESFIDELESKAPYIYPMPFWCDTWWALQKEYADSVILQITDSSGSLDIPCFVYIHGRGCYVMKRATSEQGIGINSDLDTVTVWYEKRKELATDKTVKKVFDKLVKQYNITKE